MTVNTIPAARLQFIKRLTKSESRLFFSYKYNQNHFRHKTLLCPAGCIAGFASSRHKSPEQQVVAGMKALGLTIHYHIDGSARLPYLFASVGYWPHAYQTLYAHDKIEAAVQAILAVDEYGNFTHPSTEPAKLPDIEAQIRTQIDNLSTLSNLNTQPKEMIDEPIRAR